MSGVLGCRELMCRWRLLRLVCWSVLVGLLVAAEVQAAEPLDAEVADAVFGTQVLSENAAAIREQAALLDADQRFEFLAEWVLPGPRHSGFRLSGEFSQTRPAPITKSANVGPDRNLVSPVFDLLDAAVETRHVAELRDRVAAIADSANSLQQRSRAALLLMLSLEAGDREAAGASFDVIHKTALNLRPRSAAELWPETLVAARCLEKHPDFEPLGDLLGFLISPQVRQGVPGRDVAWLVFVASLKFEHEALARLRSSIPGDNQQRAVAPLSRWVRVSREMASSCGRGIPEAAWQWDGVECRHLRGHTEDYLFYQSPLRGEFSIEADVLGYATTQFLIAAELYGPEKPAILTIGEFRTGSGKLLIDPPLRQVNKWIRLRADIKDGVNRVWVNGRLVNSREVPSDFEPWVAVRAWSRAHGAVRDLRISGQPEIPDAITLSSPGCLPGWYPYHAEWIGDGDAPWQTPTDSPDGAQIIGIRRGMPGFSLESLLRYHRPLIEDGSIEYEFYYSPGKAMTHPTLGRRTFLLEPEGVRQHWITDAQFDRTSLSPDNSFPLDNANQTGPLPLKPDDWNSLRLSITGETVRLELNGKEIVETPLHETNPRHFGLFHFSEQSEVRVRNVVMRDDWPKTLPAVEDQQLAKPEASMFDAQLAAFDPVFDHDFARDGLPEEYFEFAEGPVGGRSTLTPVGLQHTQLSDGQYRQSTVRTFLRMEGDFDVTADFTDLEIEEKQLCGAELALALDGGIVIGVKRRWQQPNHSRLVIEWALPPQEGTSTAKASQMRRFWSNIATEANSGRLRIARRGDTAFVLFAETDSSEFRVIASQTFPELGEKTAQARLTLVANQSGRTSVNWKRLRIGAERVLVVPDPRNPPKPLLYVIDDDGSNVRQLSPDIEDPEIHGYASPDWSPDGQWIAFDGWTGRAETTHCYLIRADGTGFRDIGEGTMPTFSPDGQRLALTWSRNGMATMDLTGKDRQVVTPEGWGAQWSPNGKWIAYESGTRIDGSYSANVTIIDVKTKEKRTLLEGKHATRYSQIYWNTAWSRDNRRFAFKGNVKGGQTEVAITSVDGSSKGFRIVSEETFDPDMAWHPDGEHLMLTKVSQTHSGKRLFVYDLAESKLSLLESQPMDRINTHGVWSPDGKQIVFSSRPLPGPIPWKPKQPAQPSITNAGE